MRVAFARNMSIPAELPAVLPLTVESMSVRLEPRSASMPPPIWVALVEFPVTRTSTKTAAVAT